MISTAESRPTVEPVTSAAKFRRLGFSYSLRTMLLIVIGSGLSLLSLCYASDLLASIVFSGTLTLLLISILFAAFGAAHRRPFWAGFAIFGIAYLVLAMAPWFDVNVAPHLLTERGLHYLNLRLAPVDQGDGVEVEYQGEWTRGQMVSRTFEGKYRVMFPNSLPGELLVTRTQMLFGRYGVESKRLGRCLLALLGGLIGGWIAAVIADRTRRRPSLE